LKRLLQNYNLFKILEQTNSENEPVFLHTYTPSIFKLFNYFFFHLFKFFFLALGINLEKKVVEIQGK